MKVAIVTTGDEIMAGQVIDTNASWLSDHCWKIGAKVVWRFAVADDFKEIGEACKLASQRADVVLVSGGLGPTVDDITLEAAGRAFKKKKLGVPIPNNVGTAEGCRAKLGKAIFFFLPGVPKELYPMFEDSILPWIRKQIGGRIVYREKILKCFGEREAVLDAKLKSLKLEEVRLSFRVPFPEVWVKLACRGKNKKSVEKAIEEAKKEVYRRIGPAIFGEDGATLPQVVGGLLQKKGETLSMAESCTGGFIANWFTDIPGASGNFERGVVAYSNRSKQDLLGVEEETLNRFGAVSEQTAVEMAEGVCRISGSAYGLAVTGIAGPTGGTKEKPLGTVYIALSSPGKTEVRRYCFPRDRLEFKQLVSATAFDWLRRTLL